MLHARFSNGQERLLLGGASSEIVGGADLAALLQPALQWLDTSVAQLQRQYTYGRGNLAHPLVLHGSAGVVAPLQRFTDALAPHLPSSWGDNWGVALQLEGSSAVLAAIEMLRRRSTGSVVAVGACSYHGPPSTMYGSRGGNAPGKPAQLVYPVPAEKFRHAGESTDDFVARIECEQEAFLSEHEGEVGVLLLEPQWGSAALGQPWPADALRRFVHRARARGILVCADEIMCGMGRHGQGRAFLVDAWGVEVDAITFGKAVSTGTFALSGAAVRGWRGERAPHHHTYSHGAQALALLTAEAVLRALPAWRANVKAMAAIVEEELHGLGARGQGALWGVPAAQPEVLHQRCREQGVDVYVVPDGVLLTPLLNVNLDDLRAGIQRFAKICRSWPQVL